MSNKTIKKTNATRILDKEKIEYSMHEYPVTDKPMSGIQVAEYLNENCNKVFKTLVLKSDNNNIIVAIIPVAKELDLKKLAKVSNYKKVEMIPSKDLKSNTGYVHGGCSPIGMKKNYSTFICETALDQQTIIISAGEIGKQIEIEPFKLKSVINATFAVITT